MSGMINETLLRKLPILNITFTPSAPIGTKDLFSGRIDQITKVVDTITRPGQHAIMYGERGVGKTSLANVIHDFLPKNNSFYPVKENCTNRQSFTDLWRSIFRQMQLKYAIRGDVPTNDEVNATLLHFIDQDNPLAITPSDVRFVLTQFPTEKVIIILDEFDRIKDENMVSDMVDTIKMFSDYVLPVTLVIVGVGDSIEQLIKEHASLPRALVQIRIPRLDHNGLRGILQKGIERLEMTMDESVMSKIVNLSQGLPHYTHLLALEATMRALERQDTNINQDDLNTAIKAAIEKAHESTTRAYYKAINVPRGKLYPTVLLACAIAKNDMRGYFSPADVRTALKSITGKEFHIGSFARHLKEFSTQEKGIILTQIGTARRHKYRFSDPVMQPFLIMKGLSEGNLGENLVPSN